MKSKNQKGISLYLSLVIMGILLSLALGINSILLGQAKTTQDIGNSVFAFAAAETGIEKILYDASQGADILAQCPEASPCQDVLENSASYSVVVFSSGSGDCPAGLIYCVKSVGTYKTTNRAIYVSR